MTSTTISSREQSSSAEGSSDLFIDDLEQFLDPLNTPLKVSEAITVPVGTLAFWRYQNKNLPYVKVGRMIRYKKEDVITFVRKNFHTIAEDKDDIR